MDKSLRFLLIGIDKSASRALRGVGDEVKRTEGKLGKLGAIGKGAMLGLAGAAAGAALFALDFGKKAVEAASRAEQSVGGVGAVFGKQAGEIEKAAARAAKSLGLSATSYRELATVLGAGLKNKGIKDYAGESQKLIKIGADLAAQYGGDTTTAVEALASAMRGESDPIEKYGVSLNESAVNAELAARGQTKLKGAALDTAKAQARLAIITRQTADAQGAFGRESNTLAGKQQRAQAQYENLQATLGQKLLPAMVKMTEAGIQIMDWLDANPAALEGAAAAWDVLVMAFEGLAEVARVLLLPTLVMTGKSLSWLLEGAAGLAESLGNTDLAKSLREMKGGVDSMTGALEELGKKKPTPTVSVKDQASAKVKSINDRIKALKGKVVEAKAKGDTKEVDRLNRAIKALRNKRVTVQANVAKTGISTIRVQAMRGASDRVSVRAYASGGRPKVGQLAMFHADELWVPDTAGTVLTKAQTRRAIGSGPAPMGGAGAGGVVNINVQGDTDPDAAARRIEDLLYRRRNRAGRLKFQ